MPLIRIGRTRRTLKISRFEVYRILVTSTLTGGAASIGTAYWGHLRKAVG